MIAKRVALEEARINLAEVIHRVRYLRERFVISKHGKPVAMVIPLGEIPEELPEHFQANLKDFADVEVSV